MTGRQESKKKKKKKGLITVSSADRLPSDNFLIEHLCHCSIINPDEELDIEDLKSAIIVYVFPILVVWLVVVGTAYMYFDDIMVTTAICTIIQSPAPFLCHFPSLQLFLTKVIKERQKQRQQKDIWGESVPDVL